jgi:glycosyltransferase involved in cell wall biosynthesis
MSIEVAAIDRIQAVAAGGAPARTLACSVGYGGGGLGQHFAQLVEDFRAAGLLARYYTPQIRPGDEVIGQVVTDPLFPKLLARTPLRYSSGWKGHLSGDLYDIAVARQMQQAPAAYIGFGGQSLHSFQRARQLGCKRLELVAANSHVRNVARMHRQGLRQYGIETSWLNGAQIRKTLREYAEADVIYVASEYTRRTFLAEGVAADKLVRVHYETAPRFAPPESRTDDGVFRIVFIGSITVMKGVPVLLDAFARLPAKNAELILVGGWASRGMRHYMEAQLARDPRIKVAPGDPMPHLHRASVCVHPTYEDGWSYAPMEALACGVPVIVTEDTGMKEKVQEGFNGYVVPTGSWEAILERLKQIQQRPLRWQGER